MQEMASMERLARMQGRARFDRSGQYRYLLSRDWDPSRPRVAFVMLNPNRADATRDDPTIRRCVGFARSWGFGALDVVNLFALRAPRPALLRTAAAPLGARNDRFVREACCRASLTVAAWGVHGAWHAREQAVLDLLRPYGVAMRCLGVTAGGHPRHPLYLPASTALQPFPPPQPQPQPQPPALES